MSHTSTCTFSFIFLYSPSSLIYPHLVPDYRDTTVWYNSVELYGGLDPAVGLGHPATLPINRSDKYSEALSGRSSDLPSRTI